jgi:quinol monooxygenase YgiN
LTTIQKDGSSNLATVINVFTVIEPANQQRLVDILIEATEKVMNKEEGFISANIHKSLDGTHVVNYAQWKSKEAFEKMLNNPKVIVHMNEISTIAKGESRLYEVVFVDDSGSSNSISTTTPLE